jgi:transglutaminase-like putative cysteine protease
MIEHGSEERIRSWLLATAQDRAPGRVLAATFDRTRPMAQTSRRRRWASLTMRPLPIVFATAAMVVVLVAVNAGLIGNEREPGGVPLTATMGQTAIIGQVWTSSSDVAFTIERDPMDDHVNYWRAAAYDGVDFQGWKQTNPSSVLRAAGTPLLDGLADDVDPTNRRSVTFTVTPNSFSGPIVSPATPVSVDRDVELKTVGREGFFASVESARAGAYTVTALLAENGGAAGMLNASALRAAGTDYPPEVAAMYTAEVPGMFGPNLRALRDEAVRTADSQAPIDIAQRLVELLQDPAAYTYDTDVRDIPCASMSAAECFATYRRGYCQHYATTMAVVLRDLGIPARLVAGFLPGQRSGSSIVEVVPISAAHAWVEVYFPAYKWVAFDPTGGGIAQLSALP